MTQLSGDVARPSNDGMGAVQTRGTLNRWVQG